MIPVLIGGGLAIVGGILGHILMHLLESKRESKRIMRSKAEDFVKAIYRHASWLEEKQNCLFKQESHDSPSPLDEARMIQRLYFPEASELMVQISQAQLPLLKFLGEQRIKQMKDLQKWIDEWNAEEFYKAYEGYLNIINEITLKMRSFVNINQ